MRMQIEGLLVVGLANLVGFRTEAAEPTPLSMRRAGQSLELSWPGTTQKSGGSVARPYFELQRSTDLLRWQHGG